METEQSHHEQRMKQGEPQARHAISMPTQRSESDVMECVPHLAALTTNHVVGAMYEMDALGIVFYALQNTIIVLNS